MSEYSMTQMLEMDQCGLWLILDHIIQVPDYSHFQTSILFLQSFWTRSPLLLFQGSLASLIFSCLGMAFIHNHLSKFLSPLRLLLDVMVTFQQWILLSNLPDFYDDSILIYLRLPQDYLHLLNNTLTRTNNTFILSLEPLLIALKGSSSHMTELYNDIVILFADCLDDGDNKRQTNFIGSRPWLLLLFLRLFGPKAYGPERCVRLSRPHNNNYKFQIMLFNDDKYEWMLHDSSDFYKNLKICQNQIN